MKNNPIKCLKDPYAKFERISHNMKKKRFNLKKPYTQEELLDIKPKKSDTHSWIKKESYYINKTSEVSI